MLIFSAHDCFTICIFFYCFSCLDACGCGKITDRGVQALAAGCKHLQMLDLSSTKVTARRFVYQYYCVAHLFETYL